MTARLGGRRFPDHPGCPHCAAPVQTTNYALGPKVEHYDPDASFRDSIWWHCRLTVAALPPSDSDDRTQSYWFCSRTDGTHETGCAQLASNDLADNAHTDGAS